MSRRSKDLFEEMQGIFGESFNPTVESLSESLDEGAKHARGGDMRPMPSKRGNRDAVSKRTRKQKFHKPGKAKRDRDMTGLKKIQRTAAKTATKDDDSALKAFFKDPEVRGNKGSDSKSKASVGRLSPKGKGGGGSQDKSKGTSASNSEHHPFKNKTNLGKGPRGSYLNKTKCWNCTCPGNIYDSGCNCKSSGNGANCPEKGTLKKIKYSQSYKKSYNDEYHAWRAGKDKKQRD